MTKKVFLSHTKYDKIFLDKLDTIFARTILAFRSELETMGKPAWRTLRDEMRKSVALFLIIGNHFRTRHTSRSRDWQHTQNWIAYEIGLACQLGIDVWVVCEQRPFLNFPVPYLNNYIYISLPKDINSKHLSINHGLYKKTSFEYLKEIGSSYAEGGSFPVNKDSTTCKICGAIYNLHNNFSNHASFTCPQCLTSITKDGKKKRFVPMPEPPPSSQTDFLSRRLRPPRSPGIFDREL